MHPIEPRSPISLMALTSALGANGLDLLGAFNVNQEDSWFSDRTKQPRAVAVIGNVGSAIWPFFENARRGQPDLTLDQWTENIVDGIASDRELEAVYPFSGPPYYPFVEWGKRTGTLFSSPLGLAIHPDHGLWIAFRAALLLDHRLDDERPALSHPCSSCDDRPCLSACPVGAFTGDDYDFRACLDQVATPINPCREGGCLARIACPVGRPYRYERAHAAFHMHQLLKAHGKV
jgi:ferredoxin-like protein FixX